MDFEEWMIKNYSGAFDMPHPREAYKAGQQSKQAEIDGLQQQNQRLAMRLDVIQGVLQKQTDLIVELKNGPRTNAKNCRWCS